LVFHKFGVLNFTRMKTAAIEYDAALLRRTRIKKRWTQRKLARLTGLSIGTISEVESGNAPWIEAIGKMEHVLGVVVDTVVVARRFKN
jgi:transcriptional regulator with XRE-family HTH domain